MNRRPFLIRTDRFLLAIKWCGWATHFAGKDAPERQSPDGFAGRERTREIVRRFGISTMIYTKPDLLGEAVALLTANPKLHGTEIDISGVLAGFGQRFVDPERDLGGFKRFLHALACGELTEANLMGASVA